ncbi:MAG: hypothetical protein EAX96_02705 [Candidatus Lokiarchaeota archaeon]|nr:hypothetical protein [Candidatus Lokiarchaeota archaeon]
MTSQRNIPESAVEKKEKARKESEKSKSSIVPRDKSVIKLERLINKDQYVKKMEDEIKDGKITQVLKNKNDSIIDKLNKLNSIEKSTEKSNLKKKDLIDKINLLNTVNIPEKQLDPKENDIIDKINKLNRSESANNEILQNESNIETNNEQESDPERKPHGYWKDPENFYREMQDAIDANDGKFPMQKELREMGFISLDVVSRNYGGLMEVKKKMGFTLDKKPFFYWKNPENFYEEVKRILEKNNNQLPSMNELKKTGKGNIVDAAKRYYGGMRNVRKQLGLDLMRKPPEYWKDPENFFKEMKNFIKENNSEFPTIDQLRRKKRHDLETAAEKLYGGLFEVKKKMGLLTENDSKFTYPDRKPANYWKNKENFFGEMEKLIKNNDKNFPTLPELEEMGRKDLQNAIVKYYGGINNVRAIMGFPIENIAERNAYFSRRGYSTERITISIIKNWMDLNGFNYSTKKQIKVSSKRQLECVCGKNKKIGIDITNAKYPRTVEMKWTKRMYHKYVDQLWIIVVSDKWNEKQYKKWNQISPDNVTVVNYKNLVSFLNEISSGNVDFDIPHKKKIQLEALARCTFENREKIKREYEMLKKQKSIEEFFDDKKE